MGAVSVPRRRPNWESTLAAEIEAARLRPFQWGRHDCVSWSARVVRAISTRRLPAIGRYSSELGAAKRLRKAGYQTPADAATAALGAPLPTPLMAQRGDVVLHAGALGVCVGGKAAFVGPAGLEFRALRECAAAWRV